MAADIRADGVMTRRHIDVVVEGLIADIQNTLASLHQAFSIRHTQTQTLAQDTDILEYICSENERDRAHIAGQLGGPNTPVRRYRAGGNTAGRNCLWHAVHDASRRSVSAESATASFASAAL